MAAVNPNYSFASGPTGRPMTPVQQSPAPMMQPMQQPQAPQPQQQQAPQQPQSVNQSQLQRGSGGFLWKPISQGGLNPGGTSVLFNNHPKGRPQSVEIVDANGNVVDHLRSGVGNEGIKFYSNKPGSAYGDNFSVRATWGGGYSETYNIKNGGQRWEGGFGNPNPTLSNKGPQGGGGGGQTIAGIPAGGGGGSSGVGALPFNLSNLYPTFQPVSFPTIQPADYTFTNPQQFAQQFGDFNRGQIGQNFGQAQDFALSALDTELKGLSSFAPAAAALARGQTSVDNSFNQAQRTAQVNTALPDAGSIFSGIKDTLGAQAGRAADYAAGRLPSDQLDRALELGIRSRAADTAGFSGIGSSSQQARNISDLMSADERFQIAQYGEGLTGQNIGQQEGLLRERENLFLAPTEYSQTGSQIRPTPEVGAGRLTYQGLGELDQGTLVSPGQALSTQVQQQQFKTNLAQQTNMFNAQGMYDAAKYNSAGQFAAGLGLFNYQVGLASQVQGANQANLNTALNAGTAGQGAGAFDAGIANGQAAQTIQSAATSLGVAPAAVTALTGALAPNNAPTVQPQQTSSVPTGGTVGGTSSVNTTPSSSSTVAQQQAQPLQSTAPSSQAASIPAGASRGVDVGSPQTMKIADGVPVPQGYTPIASNGDGSYSAANNDSYKSDLERFAKFGSGPPTASVSVQNAGIADRNISSAAGLSYVPAPQLKQVAMSASGRPVYSTPQAAANGDTSLGAQHTNSLAMSLAALGGIDSGNMSAVEEAIRSTTEATQGNSISELDKLHSENGGDAVAQAILNKVTGGKPNLETNAGQQLAAGAARIGELWGNLSPAQKSLAIASLTTANINHKSGGDIANKAIPGTEKSVAGPLRVGDAMSLLGQGVNGFGMARNWNQISAVAHAAGLDTKDPKQLGYLATNLGILGFGPEGSAVPVDPKALHSVGAMPATAFGVGAAFFKDPNDVPKHYTPISRTSDGQILAMPENLAHTSIVNSGSVTPLAYRKGQEISNGQHPIQKNWGPPPGRGIQRGSVGGSAMISGLGLMKQANPTLLGAVMAHSLYRNVLGHEEKN